MTIETKRSIVWGPAPIKTSWGEGMMVADVALDRDSTVSLYAHADDIAKVDALFADSPPADERAQQGADPTSKAQYRRMFIAACEALGAINERLGLDPDDGGAEPIIEAIDQLQAQRRHDKPGEEADPLQSAANWLSEAIIDLEIGDIQRRLFVGFHRAQRLLSTARSKEQS